LIKHLLGHCEDAGGAEKQLRDLISRQISRSQASGLGAPEIGLDCCDELMVYINHEAQAWWH